MKVKIIAVTAVILLILGGYIFYRSHFGKQSKGVETAKMQMPPMEVSVYTVKSGEIIFTKDLPGRTSAYQTAEIRPQVSGIITKRLFKEGSLVKQGQQLYQIDSAPYQAAYDSAAAALEKAYANLKSAEPKAVRYAELVKVGGVSSQENDDAASAFAQSKAEIAVAKAAMASAKINLDYTKVYAPISGRIGKSSVTEGALVTANQENWLAVIQNIDKIYVDVNQSSTEIVKLRKQFSSNNNSYVTKAKLIIDDEKEPYNINGIIQFSDITVDEATGMVQLRIIFDNPKGELLPGLFVKSRIEQSRQNSAITIPQPALIRNADGSTVVWIVDNKGVVNVSPVQVSKVIGNKWLVTSGLKDGDKVIVSGFQKTAPDAKVIPVEAQQITIK